MTSICPVFLSWILVRAEDRNRAKFGNDRQNGDNYWIWCGQKLDFGDKNWPITGQIQNVVKKWTVFGHN